MEDGGPGMQAVVFSAGGTAFGADIRDIREIIRLDGLTPLPDASRHFEGVADVRGEIVPLLSLRSLTGSPPGGHDKETRVLILDRSPPLGLIVDMVGEVRPVPGMFIEPMPPIAGVAGSGSLYRGIAKLPDRMIIIMDLSKISSSPEGNKADNGPATPKTSSAGAPPTATYAEGSAGGDTTLKLTEFQLDALREMGNIGTSHSATSLSKLVGSTITITVPAIMLEKIERLSSIVAEEKVVGLLMEICEVDGTAGYLYTMFPEKSAFHIVDTLMGQPPGTTTAIGESEQSATMEVGNILASAFCDAVAEFLGLVLLPSPPNFVWDMAGAIVESSMITIGQIADDVIVFKTHLVDDQGNCEGYVILFPNPETLDRIVGLLEAKANP